MNTNTNDYESVNTALDRIMSSSDVPAAAGDTVSDSASGLTVQNKDEASGSGTLIAQVSTAGGAIPLMGGSGVISDANGEKIATQFTDNSGRTPGIKLSAPSAEYSLEPTGFRPYSTYNMRAEYPGYYTEVFLNIAVFDKIVSVQPFSMDPLGEDATECESLIIINEDVNS